MLCTADGMRAGQHAGAEQGLHVQHQMRRPAAVQDAASTAKGTWLQDTCAGKVSCFVSPHTHTLEATSKRQRQRERARAREREREREREMGCRGIMALPFSLRDCMRVCVYNPLASSSPLCSLSFSLFACACLAFVFLPLFLAHEAEAEHMYSAHVHTPSYGCLCRPFIQAPSPCARYTGGTKGFIAGSTRQPFVGLTLISVATPTTTTSRTLTHTGCARSNARGGPPLQTRLVRWSSTTLACSMI